VTTKIEWTDVTWNPVTGCDKVSQGCRHCYAERMAARLQAMGQARYLNGFKVTMHDDLIDLPRTWRKPRMVFANSMSDLFHHDITLDFIQRCFQTMLETPQHTYQVLTKRSERLVELSPYLPWRENMWMGVSVEDNRVTHRIQHLRQVPAHVRFLSCEPLIGPLDDLPLEAIHWVIVGGESGPGCRPMQTAWAESILRQCRASDVPFFFKQFGGTNKKKAGRVLNGRTYDEFPRHARMGTMKLSDIR